MTAKACVPMRLRQCAGVREASARGVAVLGSDAFAIGHVPALPMIRVSLGGSLRSHSELLNGLTTLAA